MSVGGELGTSQHRSQLERTGCRQEAHTECVFSSPCVPFTEWAYAVLEITGASALTCASDLPEGCPVRFVYTMFFLRPHSEANFAITGLSHPTGF